MLSILTSFAETAELYTTTTSSSEVSGGAAAAISVMYLIFGVIGIISIVALWKVFQKAGRPGWASIVPIYNVWVLFEIVGYPGWWALLYLIPIVNIFPGVMILVAYFKLAKMFGKSDVFAVMNVLFSFVTLPILAFGKDTFQGRGVAAAAPMGGQPSIDPAYPTVTPVSADPVVVPQTSAPQTPGENTPPTTPQPPTTPPTNPVQ